MGEDIDPPREPFIRRASAGTYIAVLCGITVGLAIFGIAWFWIPLTIALFIGICTR